MNSENKTRENKRTADEFEDRPVVWWAIFCGAIILILLAATDISLTYEKNKQKEQLIESIKQQNQDTLNKHLKENSK